MYTNVDEMESAIANFAAQHPEIAERIALPNETPEDHRTVSCLRIGSNAAGAVDGALYIFGQHAREWVPPEIAMNLMADLISAYVNNHDLNYGPAPNPKTYTAAQVREIVDNINIFIVPCVNPDGHAFTHSFNASQSLAEQQRRTNWRRNRNLSYQSAQNCQGVDLNRNYDFTFDLDKYYDTANPGLLARTSADPCHFEQVYQGPSPFSEPETQNIRWLVDTYPRIRWFIDVHGHASLILHPWGDDVNQTTKLAMNWRNEDFDQVRGRELDAYKEYISANDLATHVALSNRLREGIEAVRNQPYTVKQIFFLYPVAGSASDWIWSRHIVDPSLPRVEGFAIEVRGGPQAGPPFQFGFQPAIATKDDIVEEVTSGLLNFSLATVCGLGLTAAPDSLNVVFNTIPEGRIGSRPVILRVTGCQAATFRVVSGPSRISGAASISFGIAVGTRSVPAIAAPESRELYLWLTVQGGAQGESATGTVRVDCPETGQTWDITLNSNFVRAPRAGAVLILDRSGSMSDDAGDGRTRLKVLQDSAPAFVEVAPPNTRVGLVRFATDASSGAPMTTIGPEGPDPSGRQKIRDAITDHTLATGSASATSIGDGVYSATALIEPETDVDFKSLIVLTDGHENSKRYLADIASLINNRVFAIGLGRVQDIQPIALDTLTNKTGGFMLVTGTFDDDDPYRLAKYYLQILAGVTNDQVVLDPDGWLPLGTERKIPFNLNEADQSVDTIVLTPFPDLLRVRLQTPSGEILDQSHPSLKWTIGNQIGFFRFTLPVPGEFSKQGPGLWKILLGFRSDWKKRWKRLSSQPFIPGTAAASSVRYQVMVHARSEVTMAVAVAQNSRTPGARITIRARLTQYESVPIEGANVRALIGFPDNSVIQLSLNEVGAGVYETNFAAELYGRYPMLISAEGHSLRGFPFTREAFRNALIWRGGDNPPPTGTSTGGNFFHDLISENVLDVAQLKRVGVDIEKLLGLFQPETEEPIRSADTKPKDSKSRPGKKKAKRKTATKR